MQNRAVANNTRVLEHICFGKFGRQPKLGPPRPKGFGDAAELRRRFARSTGGEGGDDRLLKPLQPFFRNIGSFFCMGQLLLELFNRGMTCFQFRNSGPFLCQLLLEVSSQEMACLQLFLQNTNLLICFDTFRADTLGESQCVHSDPLRFILDTRHRPSCGAYHVERLKVVARLRRSLIGAGTLHG